MGYIVLIGLFSIILAIITLYLKKIEYFFILIIVASSLPLVFIFLSSTINTNIYNRLMFYSVILTFAINISAILKVIIGLFSKKISKFHFIIFASNFILYSRYILPFYLSKSDYF